MEIDGLKMTLDQLLMAEERVRMAFNHAVVLEGERIMAESKGECPVDTGALRASGNVSQEEEGTVTLGYPLDYAVYVHENLSAIHPTGKAKFLEDPVNRNLPILPETIGSAIARALGV